MSKSVVIVGPCEILVLVSGIARKHRCVFQFSVTFT